MKRRNFLKYTAALSPLMLNGVALKAFSGKGLESFACNDVLDRVLVLVQLGGGNDGINTIIPIDQYSTYANLRPSLAIPDTGTSKYIDLDTTMSIADQVGLHPNMTGLKALYDAGKMNVVQGAGYAQQNKSHFKSTDLWLTGGDGTAANSNIADGWMGRYLDYSFPGVAGNPTPSMPDPLGIQLGDSKPSLGFHTLSQHKVSINLSGQDPAGFYNLVQGVGGDAIVNIPNTEHGGVLQHIMNIENSMSVYSQRISNVFNAGSNSTVVYPQFGLAEQLKTVARLMMGGCKTKVYLTQIRGFDTHNEQVDQTDPTVGMHADLLLELSESVKAFQDDLAALGLEDKVLTMTFSEFGRKALENGNYGTDHGNLAPMMIFGKGVEPGVEGTNVDLSNLDSQGALAQSPMHDYRQVFTTVLQDWLGASDTTLTDTLFDPFINQKLGIINSNYVVDPSCYDPFTTSVLEVDAKARSISLYPNPAIYDVTLEVQADVTYDAQMRIFNASGNLVRSEYFMIQGGGYNQFTFDVSQMPAGNYFVQIISDGWKVGKAQKLSVIK